MRMAPDHLLRNRLDHTAKIKESALLGNAGLENNLEKEIAQLFLQIVHVAARNGVGYLIGFPRSYKGLWSRMSVRGPMRNPSPTAQGLHDLNKPLSLTGRLHQRGPQARRK